MRVPLTCPREETSDDDPVAAALAKAKDGAAMVVSGYGDSCGGSYWGLNVVSGNS